MSDQSPDPRRVAAARALCGGWHGANRPCDNCLTDAGVALAAADAEDRARGRVIVNTRDERTRQVLAEWVFRQHVQAGSFAPSYQESNPQGIGRKFADDRADSLLVVLAALGSATDQGAETDV